MLDCADAYGTPDTRQIVAFGANTLSVLVVGSGAQSDIYAGGCAWDGTASSSDGSARSACCAVLAVPVAPQA